MFGLGINNPFNLKERSREEIDSTKTEDQSAYQKFFAKELKKRGVKSLQNCQTEIRRNFLTTLMLIGKAIKNPTKAQFYQC